MRSVFAGIELEAKRTAVGVVPLGFAQVQREPGEVPHLIVVEICAEKKLAMLQHRKAPRKRDRLLEEIENLRVTLEQRPVEPVDLVVLAVRVVIAALRAGKFVAA